jgi:hypothetical protein
MRLFFGHDEREFAGTTAFVASAIHHASAPLQLTPLTRTALPGIQEGSNAFTLRRFMIPKLMGYQGWACFVDGADMIFKADPHELFALRDGWNQAVQVVKHDYRTRFPRKYVGTSMECDNRDYPKKQWASCMLINCAHSAWKTMPDPRPEIDPLYYLQFRFLEEDRIGSLPIEWGWLVDEYGPNPNAKLLHWTAGIPGMTDEWCRAYRRATECST